MDACPFLVPVVADRLWLYPVGVYCRRPDHGVRVPGRTTVDHVCTTPAHRRCAGYRETVPCPGRPSEEARQP